MKILPTLKKALLPGLAAVMVLAAGAGVSSAYFTTYVTAQGGYTLQLEDVRITPHESVDVDTKSIQIENTGEEAPCFVRVKVVATSDIPIQYGGEGWTLQDDGYWYYAAPILPQELTGVLTAKIALPTGTEEKPIPEGSVVNVVVIAECAPVLYDENDAPYADWNAAVKAPTAVEG